MLHFYSLYFFGRNKFLAYLNIDDRLFLGERCLYVSHTDAYLGVGQHDAGGNIAYHVAGFVADFVAVTRNSTLQALEMHQFALYTFGFLLSEEITIDKVFGIELCDPSQACLERRSGVIYVMAVKTVPFLRRSESRAPKPIGARPKGLPTSKSAFHISMPRSAGK